MVVTRRRVTIAFLILVGALPSPRRVVSAAQAVVPASRQRFEVSSVTECPPTTVTQTGGSRQFTLGAIRPVALHIEHTRVAVMCVTVEVLIHIAYNGGQYGHRNAAARDVIGGPTWIRSDRYTIEGSADGVQNPDLTGAMMRNLLEERFQLRVRRGVDDAPMYALKVARGGLKIKPMAAGDCVAASGAEPLLAPQAPGAEKPVPCGTFKGSMKGTLHVWDLAPVTMKAFANLLDLDRQVIDKTGVKDRFAIHFERETAPEGASTAALVQQLEQQLGLTLVSTKGRRSWVQIESIERPR